MYPASEITETARDARRELGFGNEGPLPDILQVIEEGAGVAVTVLKLAHRFAGAYARRENQGFIFVNATLSLDEQRFALAHAYGHHVLSHHDVIDHRDQLFERPTIAAEAKANEFAMEFLAPTPAVMRSLRGWNLSPHEVNRPQTVFRLAKYFGVSPELASAQLAATEIARGRPGETVTRTARHSLERAAQDSAWTPFSNRQDSLALAQDSLPRLPAVLQTAAIKAYTTGEISLDQLAEMLQRNPSEIRDWLAVNDIVSASRAPR